MRALVAAILTMLPAAAQTPARPGGIRKIPAVKPAPRPAAPAASALPDTALGLRAAPRGFAPLAPVEAALPNGLRLLLVSDRRLPWVTGSLVVHTGTLADPADRAGLTEVAARALRGSGGGAGLDPDATEDRLERAGIDIAVEVGESALTYTLRCPSGALDGALAILGPMISTATPVPEAIDRARAVLRDRVSARNANAEAVAAREAAADLLGASAPPRPEFETLNNIGPEDVRSLLAKHVTPGNAVLILGGDFDPAAARAAVEKAFGAWSGAAPQPVSAPAAEPRKPAGMRLADLAYLPSAVFALSRRAPGLGDPMGPAVLVLAELAGGAGNQSRIAWLAHEHPSWSLRGRASWEAAPNRPGIFAIRGTADSSYPVEALRGLFEKMEEIRAGSIDEAGLAQARARAISAWTGRLSLAPLRLAYDETAVRAGLPAGHSAAFLRGLHAVTKADVAAAAKTLLDPAGFHLALLTNATISNRPLSDLREPALPIDLTIAPARPFDAKTDPASLEEGRKQLARFQEALGGRARLAALRDFTIVSEGTHLGVPVKVWDRWLGPATYRQDQETGGSRVSVFYDGEIGWVGTPGRVGPLPPYVLTQVRGELFRLPPLLASSDSDPKRTVSHSGGNILVIRNDRDQAARLYLDESTGLPGRLTYRSANTSGAPVSVEEIWTEWKDFGSIKFPTRILVRHDGTKVGDMTVTEVKTGSGITKEEMERKP